MAKATGTGDNTPATRAQRETYWRRPVLPEPQDLHGVELEWPAETDAALASPRQPRPHAFYADRRQTRQIHIVFVPLRPPDVSWDAEPNPTARRWH
jgi:hypothetical protein